MCGCGCGKCGSGLLGLLGDLRLAPMYAGDRFSFGFESTLGGGPGFGSNPFSYEGIATLIEDAGLSYNTRSYQAAGIINPFIVIDGVSAQNWDSASDLRDSIFSVVQSAGYWPNSSTIRFEAETHPEDTQAVTTQRSDSGVPSSGLNLDSISSKLGITSATTLAIGAALALGAFALLSRR